MPLQHVFPVEMPSPHRGGQAITFSATRACVVKITVERPEPASSLSQPSRPGNLAEKHLRPSAKNAHSHE